MVWAKETAGHPTTGLGPHALGVGLRDKKPVPEPFSGHCRNKPAFYYLLGWSIVAGGVRITERIEF